MKPERYRCGRENNSQPELQGWDSRISWPVSRNSRFFSKLLVGLATCSICAQHSVAQIARVIQTDTIPAWVRDTTNWSPFTPSVYLAYGIFPSKEAAWAEASLLPTFNPCPGTPIDHYAKRTSDLYPDGIRTINGETVWWTWNWSATYCATGHTGTYSNSVHRIQGRCPPSTPTIEWRIQTASDNTGDIQTEWCEGKVVAVDPPPPSCSASGAGGSGDTGSGSPGDDGVGNPILPSNGDKVESDLDYRSPNGALSFVRSYSSLIGGFSTIASAQLVDRISTVAAAGCYPTSATFDGGGTPITVRACLPYKNTTVANTYQVQRANGRWLAFEGPAGNITSEPFSDYRLEKITDAQGAVTYRLRTDGNAFEIYDVQGKLVRQVTAGGRLTTFQYSDAATPTSTAPRSGLLIKQVDAFGRELGLTYDSNARLSSLTDPAGKSILYGYDTAFFSSCTEGNCQRLTSIQYPDGFAKTYLYNESGLSAANQTLSLTGKIDERGIRVGYYGYDTSGQAISTAGAGGVGSYSLSYPDSTTAQIVDPLGQAITQTYSSVSWVYGGTRLLKTRSQPAGAGCNASTHTTTYDSRNNPTSSLDFNGYLSCSDYDAVRNVRTVSVSGLPSTQYCSAVTATAAVLPAGARKTSTQWHPDWRLVTRRAEPGRITTYVYNGQPDPFNGNALASCAPTSALLPDGKPIAVLCRQVEQATSDADGSLGFAASVQPSVAVREDKWTYNSFGQVLTHDGPRTDLSDITTYTYYSDTTADHTTGDLWKVTNPLGKITTFTKYDKHGHVLEEVDANGVTTSYSYDLRLRLKSSSVAGLTTTYDYDPAGKLKKVTQPDTTWVGYDYDDAHRLVAIYDNRGNRVDYALDNAGNRLTDSVKDPSGSLRRTVSRTFDALGRLQQLTGRE